MSGRTLRPALLVNHLKGGGKEQFVVTLANALRADGHLPIVVCLERAGRLARSLDPAVPCVELGKAPGNSLRILSSLAGQLKDHAVDVVHSNNWGTLVESLAASQLAGGLPVVHTQHGLDYERGRTRGASSRAKLWAQRFAGKRLSAIAAVSRDVQRMVVQEWRLPEAAVTLVHNGVPLAPSPVAREEARIRLGLPNGAFVVGTVGYLRPVKAYPDLVRAVATLRRAVPDARLVIVGDGPSRHEIDEAVRVTGARDWVSLPGSRSDVPDLLKAFDVFAMSSLSEGISLALLEAMAAGLPSVVTNVGGNPEIIAGPEGVLVPSGNITSMAEALACYATAPALRSAAGSAALERVRRAFSVSQMSGAYAGMYTRVQ